MRSREDRDRTGKLAGGTEAGEKPGHAAEPLTSTMAPGDVFEAEDGEENAQEARDAAAPATSPPARTSPDDGKPDRPGSPASSPTAKATAANTAARIARIRNLSCSAIKRVIRSAEARRPAGAGGLPELRSINEFRCDATGPRDAGAVAVIPARPRPRHGDVSEERSVPDLQPARTFCADAS